MTIGAALVVIFGAILFIIGALLVFDAERYFIGMLILFLGMVLMGNVLAAENPEKLSANKYIESSDNKKSSTSAKNNGSIHIFSGFA